MTAARLIIWRHGRTAWNATGRFQGQADIPLDEVGRGQAAAAAPRIAALGPTAIVASDLSRAAETADALARVTGLTVTYDRRLREIDVGSWEGLTVATVEQQDPGHVHDHHLGADFRRSATGETAGEVADRVAAALTEIVGAADDDAVVVAVMHGLAGRVGMARFLDLEPNRFGGMRNCGWINLERHRLGHWLVREYNATAPETGMPAPEDRVA
ncbi:putative phosphoglycerate mutase [Friedmanniella endophytica]|uniref:Putative phosphoglycerate mutase n=1 Tax=Microlunatus kandeliicorticis TaxID=1759536 RepID=A0A7W3IVM9_9ACTN|nr:histidine phosphatase family protein [Microlunatus kandeliicorticis]MBA8795955.1 putative phosphoglycerate mutase [Microlunatus kandeliicorticis]